jgi:hypothetical protein
VDRLLISQGMDVRRLKSVLAAYISDDRQGDSLHVQALNYANYAAANGENDKDEICLLFVIEKVLQLVGFIDRSSFPTKAHNHKDPFSKKYTYHDLVIVLTLLSCVIVHGKVLKKPDCFRAPQGKKMKVGPTEEDINRLAKEREEAEKRLVHVSFLRSVYSSIEARLLCDLDAFYTRVKGNPSDMIALSESRIAVFEGWREFDNNKGILEDNDDNDDEEEDKEMMEMRKRVARRMNGNDTSDDEDD